MSKLVRNGMGIIALVQIVFAGAFYFQSAWAVSLWPFEGTTPLTFILVSSFFAAAAASTLWTAFSGNDGAFAGIALDYLGIFAPLSAFTLQLGGPSMTAFGLACLAGAVLALGLLLWGVRLPLDPSIAMPGLVKASFAVFIVVLLLVSLGLILRVPNIIPWKITPELSTLMGLMFFGSSAYFAYGLLRPSWTNAAGQLAGFLAYDLVLIVPLLARFSVVAPEHRVGLIVYVAVVTYSGLLATYYLFINPSTRLAGRADGKRTIRPTDTLSSSP